MSDTAFTATTGTRRIGVMIAAVLAACAACAAFTATAGASDFAATSPFTVATAASASGADANQAGGNPNLTITANFAFTGTNTLNNIALTLPPGTQILPGGVSATCNTTQLTAASHDCPAGSQLGTATVADGSTATSTVTLYAMAAPAASDILGIGAVYSTSGGALTTPTQTTGTGTLDETTNSSGTPQEVLTLGSFPTTYPGILGLLGGGSFQASQLTISLPGVGVSTKSETRLSGTCAAATASLAITSTATGNPSSTATSPAITPDNCTKLAYSPVPAVVAAKDKSDAGASVIFGFSQKAGESPSGTVSLSLPTNVVSVNGGAGSSLCTGTDFTKCTAIGAVSITTPALGAALSGGVYLTETAANAPQVTLHFNAPYSFTVNGALTTSSNTITFSGLPDLPATETVLYLTGSTTGLFTTACTATSGAVTTGFKDVTGNFGAAPGATMALSGCTGTGTGTGTTTNPYTISTTTPTKKPGKNKKKKGKPTLPRHSLFGVAGGKPSLTIAASSGKNGAPKLRSVKITLPKGVTGVKAKLKKAITITGTKLSAVSVKGQKITIVFKTTTKKATIKIASSGLSETSALKTAVKAKKTKKVALAVAITDATGHATTIKKTIKVS